MKQKLTKEEIKFKTYCSNNCFPMPDTMKHIWSVVCRKGLIDEATKVLSMIEVLEKIDIELKGPAKFDENHPVNAPFYCEVISFWRNLSFGTAFQGAINVAIYSPQKKELSRVPITFEIPAYVKSFRTIARIKGFTITTPGEYLIEVQEKKGSEHLVLAEIPVDVDIKIEGEAEE